MKTLSILNILILVMTLACGNGKKIEEKNKEIVKKAIILNYDKKNLDSLSAFFAETYIGHDPLGNEDIKGLSQLREAIYQTHLVFPDMHLVIEDIIAEKNKVVVRWSAGGTQKDVFMNIPPTNKQVLWTGMNIFKLEDGKIIEEWFNHDTYSIVKQLGATISLVSNEDQE
jgi:steroid delta-isomerase-like uncharacterized protein